MRSLSERKTRLIFETEDALYEAGRMRQVIFEARPAYATVRLKGLRRAFSFPYAAVYHVAVKMAVEADRAAKVRERKTSKKGGAR
jgi:hypothetical protein